MRLWIRITAAGMLALTALSSAAQDADSLLGEWRFERAQTAPWIDPLAPAQVTPWIGQSLQLADLELVGPGVLNCDQARYQRLAVPPSGLFQGGLPAPAEDVARALGFAEGEHDTLRLDCSSGSFDFHRVDEAHLLLALDNVIYTLSRSAGATAADGTPEAFAQRLLEAHFSTDMGFSPAHWQALQPRLSSALRERLVRYFAQPFPDDEVPPINGDPLTDSQEYPTRFRVDAATPQGDSASVPVTMLDGWQSRSLRLQLVREQDQWRLDDIVYERGERFSTLLTSTP